MRAFQTRWRILAAVVLTAGLSVLLVAAAPPMRPAAPPQPRPVVPQMPPPQPAAAAHQAGMLSMPAGFGAFFDRDLGHHRFGRTYAMPSNPGMSMYPMSSSYSPMSYGQMSSSYGAGMGYGSGGSGYGGGMAAGAQGEGYGAAAAESQEPMEEGSVSRLLTASGVPNEGGRLVWPVGLRILPAPDVENLRTKIETLFQEAAGHAAAGPVNPNLDAELSRDIRALRKMLLRDREQRFSLTFEAYEQSERFLTKLEHVEELLRAGLEPPGGKVQLEPQKGPTAEVGLRDNRFDPMTLTVSAGTTVRWANNGKHHHTVTSDKRDWGSKEIPQGGTFSYTFTKPGTYTYHCAIHPGDMRGSVTVK
jgi:plastocyanin